MDHPINYDFLAPQRIVFGCGRRRELGGLAKTLGRRAFLVVGLNPDLAKPLINEIEGLLQSVGIPTVPLTAILHEPEVADVDRAAERLRAENAADGDFLIALGGGAAIDLAKAAGAMATNRQSNTVKDYLENVGRDLTISEAPLPVLAMPTTAGTGAEATKNAVISSYDPPFKKSLRDNRLIPRIALVDPELTVSVPPEVTAASGMDAITQLIESYVSRKSQPIPRAFCVQGLRLAIPAIAEAVADGHARKAREAMSHAALLSGMALANSGLGMAHGIAAALGTHCRVPHGVACALMLPAAIRVNMDCRQAEFARLAAMLFRCDSTKPAEAAETFLREIESLCDRVGVPRRLGQLGVRQEQIPALVEGSRGSSMSGNPCELSDEQLTHILQSLL